MSLLLKVIVTSLCNKIADPAGLTFKDDSLHQERQMHLP
jgi:hypothetical protein